MKLCKKNVLLLIFLLILSGCNKQTVMDLSDHQKLNVCVDEKVMNLIPLNSVIRDKQNVIHYDYSYETYEECLELLNNSGNLINENATVTFNINDAAEKKYENVYPDNSFTYHVYLYLEDGTREELLIDTNADNLNHLLPAGIIIISKVDADEYYEFALLKQ